METQNPDAVAYNHALGMCKCLQWVPQYYDNCAQTPALAPALAPEPAPTTEDGWQLFERK